MAERGTSLGVQWLRFCTSTAEGTSSMGWGTRGAKTKILHGMAKKKEKKEKKNSRRNTTFLSMAFWTYPFILNLISFINIQETIEKTLK